MNNKLMFTGAILALAILAIVLYFAFGTGLHIRTKDDCRREGGEVIAGFPSQCQLDDDPPFLLDE